MLRRRFYKLLTGIMAAALCVEPLAAFDTFWHSAATSAATRAAGFSADATNIVQFGNFSGPDFFGPLYDSVLGKRYEEWLEQRKSNHAAIDKIKEFIRYRDQADHLHVR